MGVLTFKFDSDFAANDNFPRRRHARFINAATEEIADLDANRVVLRRYIAGPAIDERVAQVDASGTVTYIHTDKQNSVVALTNSSGAAVSRRGYGTYGETNASQMAETTHPFGYTGRRWESDLGLYYYRARWYDPELGTFLETDPIGAADYVNLYSYVGLNPTNGTDPNGKFMVPGDVFSTPEQAAYDALLFINPVSIAENREYSVTIDTTSAGFVAAAPVAGTGTNTSPIAVSLRTGVGDYHTHGDYSTPASNNQPQRTIAANDGYNSDNPSTTDRSNTATITNAVAATSPQNAAQYKSYLGTPSGNFFQTTANGQTTPLIAPTFKPLPPFTPATLPPPRPIVLPR